MATKSAFVDKARADLEYHISQVSLWTRRLYAHKRFKQTSKYRRGSSELWHSLMDFYGRTKGLQMWAAHLRRRRAELLRIENQIRWHQMERDQIKRVLGTYAGCFLGIRRPK